MKKVNILLKISFVLLIFLTVFNLKVYSQDLGVSINVNLDWQALNSYTPPFYEGKPLPGEEAAIKVVASTEIKTPVGNFDSSKFFYSWKINDYYSHTYSKTGGNILIFPLDELVNENVVSLEVYTDNTEQTLLTQKQISIYPRSAKALLYKEMGNPIITYANAINKRYQNYSVYPGQEFDVIAEPFYFSAKSPTDPKLSYIWSLNNIPGNTNSTNVFSYTAPSGASRNFGLGVKVSNSTESLQSSEENLNFVLND